MAEKRPSRLLVVDDHRLILEAVRNAVSTAPDLEVVGETTRTSEVLSLIRATDPDVVLLDIRMPGMDGLACLDEIRASFPDVKVVIITALDDADLVQAALSRGASGFLHKEIDPADLVVALRQAAAGQTPIMDGGRRSGFAARLSESELRVLRELMRGLSNKAIAAALWISEETVKFHLSKIYRKLGVSSRTAAVHYVYEHGLAGLGGHDKSTVAGDAEIASDGT